MSEEALDAQVADDAAVVDDAPDVETEALSMGWTPKDKFKGDESKFVDAAEFVRRGKEFLPFLKANNARLEEGNKKLEKEVQRLGKTLEKFGEFHTKTEERAYARALKDLEARQAEAVDANDAAAVKEITKEIVDLNAEVSKAGKAKVTDEPDNSAVDAWKEANPWYDKDAGLRAAVYGICEEIKGEYPDPAKQLAEATRRVKEAFPDKFKNPRREQAAAVEAVDRGGKGGGKGYNDLPADAKKMCDEFVRDIPGFTRDKYVKGYAW